MPTLPEPNVADYWVDRALQGEPQRPHRRSATSRSRRSKSIARAAGHYPTVDLVGSYTAQGANAAVSPRASAAIRARRTIGVQLNVPIYQGGFVDSRVREAIALQDKSRAGSRRPRGARRCSHAQTGFAGVNSAVASVKAFEQAVVSAESRARSRTSLGQEVGVRTNLDVLNVQQNVYSTRRDLAEAYFNYLIGVLRLKAAVGTLTEQDVEELNRQLKG